MQSGRTLWLATMNKHKFREAQKVLAGRQVRIRQLLAPKIEIQSSDLEEIASFAANNISRVNKGIVVVEDSGLFVTALGGFPGPFSAYVYRTVGSKGILRLLEKSRQRGAYFQASLAASESGRTCRVFTGKVSGRITWDERGKNGFGFDPIFIPTGSTMTFGELDEDKKSQHSHRSIAFTKLARWCLSSQNSTSHIHTSIVLK